MFAAAGGALRFWVDGQPVGRIEANSPQMAALVREIGLAMSKTENSESVE